MTKKVCGNILLSRSSRRGGLKISELTEICRKGQRVGNKLVWGKIEVSLTPTRDGHFFIIKEVSI